jgi:hypothetical protein
VQVAAERRGVQALAEKCGGARLPAVDGGDEGVERRRVPVPRGVQGFGNAAEIRVDDAQDDKCVEQRRPVVPLRDDGGQIGGGIHSAAPCAAGVTEDTRRRLDARQDERVDVDVRDHRVEHEPVDVRRVREGVALGDERPVRDPVERQPPHAERAPQHIEVGDGVGGREEAALAPDLHCAVADGLRGRHAEVRSAHHSLQRRALQRPRAGAALVEQDNSISVEDAVEPALHPLREGHSRLARATGEHQEHRVASVAADRHGEGERALDAPAVVEGDRQRRAREAPARPLVAQYRRRRTTGRVGDRARRGECRRGSDPNRDPQAPGHPRRP